MIDTRLKKEEAPKDAEEKATVLVVEDDGDMLRFVSLKLGRDYRVLTAVNGRGGLDVTLEHMPDLVVSDLMMPVMDGLELCREIKSNMLTSHIPVILLTAKDSVESQVQGLETGADDYVTKPFVMELLKARIENVLKSRQLLRQSFITHFLHSETAISVGSGADSELWEKIRSSLYENYRNPDFSPDDLAKSLHVSPRTLQRKIKALTDRTAVGLILQFRLKMAAALLEQSSLKITQIAFDVGFSDSNYFTRQFKNEYSLSPSEFRADHSS